MSWHGCLISYHFCTKQEIVYLAYFGFYNVQLMVFYPSSGLALYWALGYTLVKAFGAVADEIDASSPEICKRLSINRNENYQYEIHRWAKQHAAIYECVENFNRGMGLVLLVEIAYIFVGVINQMFYIVVIFIELKDVDFIASFLLIDHLIQLGTTCYIADAIRFQVIFLNH